MDCTLTGEAARILMPAAASILSRRMGEHLVVFGDDVRFRDADEAEDTIWVSCRDVDISNGSLVAVCS